MRSGCHQERDEKRRSVSHREGLVSYRGEQIHLGLFSHVIAVVSDPARPVDSGHQRQRAQQREEIKIIFGQLAIHRIGLDD